MSPRTAVATKTKESDRKVTINLGSLGSRESLVEKTRKDSLDNNDLISLEQLNFMNKKSVRVVRKSKPKSRSKKTPTKKQTRVSEVEKIQQHERQRQVEESELAIKYVLDKGTEEEPSNFGAQLKTKRNTCKLPASFLKMKLQQDLRQQQLKVELLKNHFRTTRAVCHDQRNRQAQSLLNNRYRNRLGDDAGYWDEKSPQPSSRMQHQSMTHSLEMQKMEEHLEKVQKLMQRQINLS